MKVKRHQYLKEELLCEFTEELTKHYVVQSEYIRVYVMDRIWDADDKEKIQYPIRVTGRTIGILTLSPDRIITGITISDETLDKDFPGCRDILSKYIGERFEVPER